MPVTERLTLAQFVNRHEIGIRSEEVGQNPHNPEWMDATHYKVALTRGRRRMTVYFSQGYGLAGEPTAASVLECLASDSSSADNAGSFEEWAADLGMDTDSRKAERTYRQCERQTAKLKQFLGPELYDTLLFHTED